jgi:EAL domain-containing protein (putative c-di-GMP-specific phosphodiesterase class I)
LLTVGASIGISRFPADGDDPERLLRCADVAMYHSKRNRLPWVRYAVESDPSDPARLELLSDLRAAIGTSQLELHYQPKVNLATDEVMGVEALLRWTHPVKGPIPPDTFISIAEQTGVMAPLTDDVLRKAAHQLRDWMRDGRDLSVAVNISAANLTEGEFVERVRRIVAEEDVPAEFIVLELTESAVMSDHRRGLEVLNELSAIGFRLSIDDFGTGYSSLSYLQRLPVDELKIDRSFVKTLNDDQVNRSIIRSTVDLGHNLGLSVVAEGVEDEATLKALTELGCDVAQGYYLSRPLPAAALVAWLESRKAATTVLSDGSATLQLP